jgi:catechol 1,2-dioxygenase
MLAVARIKLTGTFKKAGNDKYTPLVTQIFDRKTQYLENDSVFAVKDDLVVDFKPISGNPKASLELEYNIRLAAGKS